VEGKMTVTVMNWFFGISAGLMLIVFLTAVVYAKVKKQKIERIPILVILLIGYAGCAVAIMNLRDTNVGLAVFLTVVEFLLLAISGPMIWKPFIKHLRDEELIPKKRVD
jgi:hypothetical protein